MRTVLALLLLTCAFVGPGCADASIRKVPKRSDYPNWTPELQSKVDGMCGLRVYRSRAYVVVKKPFPLQSEALLIDGEVSPDGKFVRLLPRGRTDITSELSHWGVCVTAKDVLPSGSILKAAPSSASRAADGAITAQGPRVSVAAGHESVVADTTAQGTPAGTVTPGELDQVKHEKDTDAPTGTATVRLSTALDAQALQVLGDALDITYLPDYEEEYVIDPRANLGEVNLHLTQGPGGTLLAMGMQVDNSAVTKPLVDAYTKLVAKAGEKLVGALGEVAAFGPAGTFTESVAADSTLKGSVITLRVHLVKMATPDVYPILKDSEMLESRNERRQIAPGGMMGARACAPNPDETYVVPVYPYSRVAYKYHRVVVIEPVIGRPSFSDTTGFAPASIASVAANDTPLADLTDHIIGQLNGLLAKNPNPCHQTVSVTRVVSVAPVGANSIDKVTQLEVTFRLLDSAGAPVVLTEADACTATVNNQFSAAFIVQETALTGLKSIKFTYGK